MSTHFTVPSKRQMNATGTVVQVRFVSEDKEYCVITADIIFEGKSIKEATVVGNMPLMDTYDGFEAQLVKEKKERWGEQYRAERLMPTGKPGQLDSGSISAFFQYNFKGIGPKIGQALADTFGPDIFNLLDQDPEPLKSVAGITEALYEEITQGWKDYRNNHLNIIGLQELGLSPKLANRVQLQLGAEALALLEEDMYRLMSVDGIGFVMADRLALERGYAHNDVRRLGAAAQHAIEFAQASQGHSYLPESRVLRGIQHFTGCTEAEAAQAIQAMEARSRLVRETIPGDEDALYLREMHRQEQQLADKVRHLLHDPPRSRWTVPPEAETGLSAEQIQALSLPAAQRLCILTGGPGTGKTTTVKAMLQVAGHNRLQVALAAPTGKAAKRLEEATGHEAMTVHRLLGSNGQSFTHGEHLPLDVDVLIVDETSMMGQWLCSHLLSAVGNGTRVIFLGDTEQLPPVDAGQPLNDLIHLVPTLTLTQVFRQAAQNPINGAAYALRGGDSPAFQGPEHPDHAFLSHTEARTERTAEVVCELVMSLGGPKMVQVLTPMKKGPAGTEALAQALQQQFNPPRPGGRELSISGAQCRAGDPVVQTRNNYELGIFNGMLGEVLRVDDKELKVMFDGETVSIKGKELFDLQLAYALTVHRSQGSEWPSVIGVLSDAHGRMLTRNLAYTALTRAKESFHSVGQLMAWKKAASQAQDKRLTRLRERVMG